MSKKSRPVLEEVGDDDIDNMDMDIAQFDPTLKTPVAPAHIPVITRSQDQELPLFPAPAEDAKEIINSVKFTDEERSEIRKMQLIYPCYFDIHRSHKEGRRVSLDMAVENPLAKTIVDCCRKLQLPALLELDKSHPQDFGNPGRVRVCLKEGGRSVAAEIPTKRALFREIARYLEEHPTALSSIGKSLGLPYPPEYEQGFEPEELPRVKGFRMNTIVPVHSSLTMKHPMTQLIYDPEPEQTTPVPAKAVKPPKKKVMKIRG
ncbi:signal recognition particle SEC65 subunit [Metschnikowia bicuspidata]|uniref:Signal recognition particle SEC65 subunit n=1 Tax=Metschnikowia bicuspidata TaxID=27322 RepID=A0A4P9ZBV3_9ASCO|nr:signal recognition particle SEC65 subunit [Metschnikowia bicuspidata]